MRALIVDAGNSRVKCAAWEHGSALPRLDAAAPSQLEAAPPLRVVAELPTPRGGEQEELFADRFTALHGAAGKPPLVLVTTVPRVGELLAGLAPLTAVDHRSPLPFAHDLRTPAQTGPDRFCNVTTAVAAGLADALVVDAGTATTFDVLRGGVFLGGVIAPGMAFALHRLGEAAARLHRVPFAPAPLAAGRDTAQAMAAGGYHAGVGGVEAIIAGLLRHHGPSPVIITGGLAPHLAHPARHADPHWTLRGAALLAGVA